MATVIKTGFVSGVMVLALGCWGCDSDGDFDDDFGEADGDSGVVQARTIQGNGWNLNGWNLNGWNLNGGRLDTSKLYGNDANDWIQLYDYFLPEGGYAYDGALVGSMLTVDGGWLTGQNVRWTTLDFKVKAGGAETWRYVSINNLNKITGTDIWEYDLDLSIEYGPWQKLCVDEGGNPTKAILLGDVWDPTTGAKVSPRPAKALTFACKDAALAKCVLFGYRPWASASLANHHQACTRMLRADYCGDGTSHTANGTPVHVLDQIGVQTAAPNGSYVVEAEWGPNGAVCLNPGNTRQANQALGCDIPTCGASFASGGLIQSGKIVP